MAYAKEKLACFLAIWKKVRELGRLPRSCGRDLEKHFVRVTVFFVYTSSQDELIQLRTEGSSPERFTGERRVPRAWARTIEGEPVQEQIVPPRFASNPRGALAQGPGRVRLGEQSSLAESLSRQNWGCEAQKCRIAMGAAGFTYISILEIV